MEAHDHLWVRGDFIGRGSFGEVSLASSISDGSVFAAKSIDLASAHPSQISALENEIEILKSISSPFIVKYLGSDSTLETNKGGVHRNLLMEYLPGGCVSDFAPNLDEHVIRSYTWCLVSALQYLHSKGIVHCDVKGKNVFVSSTPGVAKLGDFGSAKKLGAINGDCSKQMRGSPLWMAPEVVRQERQGPESDVWALGCTVIEMVSGKPGWRDCGVGAVYQIGFSEELPEFPDGLSELGRDFLNKCLKRDPSERWNSDQLLRHPFVSGDCKIVVESSPRSVLSWPNSEFSDEVEEDDEQETETQLMDLDSLVISAERRVGELVSERRVVWESDGWEVVRSLRRLSSVSGDEREGANWGIWVSGGEATEGTRGEYSDLCSGSVGSSGEVVSWEYCWNSRAGSGCQHGLERENIAVVKHENSHNYRCGCCCKLLLLFILMKSSLLVFMRFLSLLWNSRMVHVGTVSLESLLLQHQA
ncbi:hypothetical protein Sjap_014146 [Stephania japonica]|uniref:Protein kinase domain-containing protein n=1 Tax=Stephania japonica TaxID=461633 RepID=A0AAP0IZE2_9MAGN